MALTPQEIAFGLLLSQFNMRPVSPENPNGLGQGGQRNFLVAAQALSVYGAAIVREANALLALTQTRAEEAQLASLIVEGGPVSSIRIDDGPAMVGAVNISLTSVSAKLEEQGDRIEAAQAALAIAQAALGRRAAAYAIAFGG